jgi:hypothetical protein
MKRIGSRLARVVAGALILCSAGATGVLAQQVPVSACGTTVPADEGLGFVPIPRGTIACPLLADPKEARSFASFQRGGREPFDTEIGAVGIGDSFGIVRWGGPRVGEGVQIGLVGSVFAQFDLATPSNDLINADYLIGLVTVLRRAGFTSRVRLYHQSSHLGDEYILRDGETERENLSFNAVHLILSQEFAGLRLYVGGEHLFHREPDDLAPSLVQAGLEVRQRRHLIRVGNLGAGRLLAGVDLKATEEQDWSPAISVRGGIEVGRARLVEGASRRWQLLAEFYDGPTPYGQFFRDDIRYFGVGLHFSL